MSELDEKVATLIDALLENQPRVSSDRYFAGTTNTVVAGTQLTATFTLDKTYAVRLLRAYADARTGCTYRWWINGQVYALNEIEFYLGKPVNGDIKLIIANTSAADAVIDYFIQGWGDLKIGG
jgi:hypothetical protein